MDLFLKFESEEQAASSLYDIEVQHKDEAGNILSPNREGEYPADSIVEYVKKPKFLNMDIIGDIYKPTGEVTTDSNGFDVPVMEKLEGYHVNIRLANEDASSLQDFVVVPSNPIRVWA